MTQMGKQFEKAVYRFVQGLDPSAEVMFDHSVPDRDTGTPRQCDVWINAKVGGHWPLSILVSCKDHKKKLDIGDIETFLGETHSTGASTGVIYSRSGFTGPALLKAKSYGISCCRLYQNEPADMPQSITFEQFLCRPRVRVGIDPESVPKDIETWNDFFDFKVSGADEVATMLDCIEQLFREAEKEAVQEWQGQGGLPATMEAVAEVDIDLVETPILVKVYLPWALFRAKLTAHLLEGSYCLTGETFAGSQYGPSIDLHGFQPGEGWEEITELNSSLPPNAIVIALYGGDVVDALREKLGPSPLPRGASEQPTLS